MFLNKYHLCRLFLLYFLLGICLPSSAYATGWQAHVFSHPTNPDTMFAVDKSKQTLLYFRKNKTNTGLTLVRTLPCTTGKVDGDKFREGDLKTPEGIYFIQGQKGAGLNYALYGDMAFVLNFPNPVDQAKGKTGHGIWMHGRGKPIVSRETRGCVALNNEDIHGLKPDILINSTPVVISDGVSWDQNVRTADLNITTHLTEMTKDWAQAWDTKSSQFLSFYDPSYFPEKFRARKKKLFKKYDWIDLLIDDVRCIQGPDYSVTYFKQMYAAPGFSSQGIKRLYWKKSSQGVWKIIGSEWFESPVYLDAKYRKKLLEDSTPWLETWRRSWEEGDLKTYGACYQNNALQGNLKGRNAILKHKRALIHDGKAPSKITFQPPRLVMGDSHVRLLFVQNFKSQTGYEDKGLKTLDLIRTGENSWKIASETWSALE